MPGCLDAWVLRSRARTAFALASVPCRRQIQARCCPLCRSSQQLWSSETATLKLSSRSCTPPGDINHLVCRVSAAPLEPNSIDCNVNGFPLSWVMCWLWVLRAAELTVGPSRSPHCHLCGLPSGRHGWGCLKTASSDAPAQTRTLAALSLSPQPLLAPWQPPGWLHGWHACSYEPQDTHLWQAIFTISNTRQREDEGVRTSPRNVAPFEEYPLCARHHAALLILTNILGKKYN